jgi:hypothetical protein
MLIPGGIFVPGGQKIIVLMPNAAACPNTPVPHVLTVRLPEADAAAGKISVLAATAIAVKSLFVRKPKFTPSC